MSETALIIAIGNSDNKLSQQDWSNLWTEFQQEIDGIAGYAGVTLHGIWFSASASPYQNASWALSFDDGMWMHSRHLQHDLRQILARYRQDTMAWTVGRTDLVPALTEEQPHE